MSGTALDRRFSVNDRQDGADEEIPIFADGNRNDRLDVRGIFHRVRRADAEIPVVLDRHADERSDWILKFLGQFGLLILRVLPPATAGGGSSVGEREGDMAIKRRIV